VRDGVEIPRIFRPNNKALLINAQEKSLVEEIYNNETGEYIEKISELSFNIDFNNVRESKANIVAVFVDENELSTSKQFPIIIIPKGAQIGQTKTFSEKYFENDKKKPLSSPNTEFQQEIQIKSLSNSQIKIKIKPVSQNERLIQVGDSRTLELAPNSALTLTFLHKQLRNELLSIAKISYQVFLISEDGKEYLIDTKEVNAIAPESYYIKPKEKTNNWSWIFGLFALAVIIILGVGFYKFHKREVYGSSDMSSNSKKPHISYDEE
jgi:sporulation protein YlmC with PRC-barrel domain